MCTEAKVWKQHGSVYSSEVGQRRAGSPRGGTEKSCGWRVAGRSYGLQGAPNLLVDQVDPSGGNQKHQPVCACQSRSGTGGLEL
jgi:hypothetical protein